VFWCVFADRLQMGEVVSTIPSEFRFWFTDSACAFLLLGWGWWTWCDGVCVLLQRSGSTWRRCSTITSSSKYGISVSCSDPAALFCIQIDHWLFWYPSANTIAISNKSSKGLLHELGIESWNWAGLTVDLSSADPVNNWNCTPFVWLDRILNSTNACSHLCATSFFHLIMWLFFCISSWNYMLKSRTTFRSI
jgi:hypothetical protein